MKSIIISIVMLFSLDIYAQNLYQDGKIVKGEKASYYCQNYEGTNIMVSVRNVEVKDTIEDLYYKNGKKVDEFEVENFGFCRPCMHLVLG